MAGGGKLRPGCADGNTGPAHRKIFECETHKREARRGESEGGEGHGRHIAGDSGIQATEIIVVGLDRLDSVGKELAIAQEPERGKPGTNVGGLFRPHLVSPLDPLLLPGNTTNCFRTSSTWSLES